MKYLHYYLKIVVVALGLVGLGHAVALSQGQGILTTLTGSYLVPIQTPGAVHTATTLDTLKTFIGGGASSARGETAVTGTGTAATGLTTIAACALSIKVGTAPGVGTSTVTYTTTGGTLNIFTWKPTGPTNPTLIAATDAATIGWHCDGQ